MDAPGGTLANSLDLFQAYIREKSLSKKLTVLQKSLWLDESSVDQIQNGQIKLFTATCASPYQCEASVHQSFSSG